MGMDGESSRVILDETLRWICALEDWMLAWSFWKITWFLRDQTSSRTNAKVVILEQVSRSGKTA